MNRNHSSTTEKRHHHMCKHEPEGCWNVTVCSCDRPHRPWTCPKCEDAELELYITALEFGLNVTEARN